MNYESLIEQPLKGEGLFLLVNDRSQNGLLSFTTDPEVVKYNRKVLDVDFDLESQIYSALSDNGVTTVMPIGRYITIVRIKKDETEQQMWFFDYESDLDFKEVNSQLLGNYFSKTLVEQFNGLKETMLKNFTPDDDMVELIWV